MALKYHYHILVWVIRYLRTKRIAPNKWGLVHKSMTTSRENAVVFFHHICNYFILCDNWNLVSFFYIRISTKNRHLKKKAILFKEIVTRMLV